MQETEIAPGFNENNLSIPGYMLETENSDKKETDFMSATLLSTTG